MSPVFVRHTNGRRLSLHCLISQARGEVISIAVQISLLDIPCCFTSALFNHKLLTVSICLPLLGIAFLTATRLPTNPLPTMRLPTLQLISALSSLSTATLLIDYSAPSATASLGSCQLEGSYLHDTIACPGNSSIYIKPSTDSEGTPALHYHRDPNFRRAEVKGAGDYAAEKTYFVGYKFSLGNVHEHLALFQCYVDALPML